MIRFRLHGGRDAMKMKTFEKKDITCAPQAGQCVYQHTVAL
jgi:hypothetical protein